MLLVKRNYNSEQFISKIKPGTVLSYKNNIIIIIQCEVKLETI